MDDVQGRAVRARRRLAVAPYGVSESAFDLLQGPMPPSGRSRAARCAAPAKCGNLSDLAVGADDLGGPQAHTVRPCGVPRRSFGFFPIAGKKLAPQGETL